MYESRGPDSPRACRSGTALTPARPRQRSQPALAGSDHKTDTMASPFPKYVELGENAKIREGITLRDYRKDYPDGKM